MLFSAIFSWLPAPLATLVIAALGVFALLVVAKIFRLILDLIPFL